MTATRTLVVTLFLATAAGANVAHAQVKGEIGFDPNVSAGFFYLLGANNTFIAHTWIADTNNRGSSGVWDDGNIRVLMDADAAGQGRLLLWGSGGFFTGGITADGATKSGQFFLSNGEGLIRTYMDVDSGGRGRLFLMAPDNNDRAFLGVQSSDSGQLALGGAGDTMIVQANRNSPTDKNAGAVRVYRDGFTRGELRAGLACPPFVIAGGEGRCDDGGGILKLNGGGGTRTVEVKGGVAQGGGRVELFADSGKQGKLGPSPTIVLDGATGNITKSGMVSFLVPHPEDPKKEILYVSLEGPEAGMYARGTARLANGTAVVKLPEHFAVLARPDGITVTVTPSSPDTHGLAVVRKTPTEFEVRELARGKGSFDFDYVVIAARNDLPPVQVVRERPAPASEPDDDASADDETRNWQPQPPPAPHVPRPGQFDVKRSR